MARKERGAVLLASMKDGQLTGSLHMTKTVVEAVQIVNAWKAPADVQAAMAVACSVDSQGRFTRELSSSWNLDPSFRDQLFEWQ